MNDSKLRRLWVGIAVLILLTPLGLTLPRFFGAGGAWGEWGSDEIGNLIGYIPEGMKRLSELWSAPFSDYAFSGWDKGIRPYVSYILSGFIGVVIVAALAYILGRLLKRSER